MKDTPTPTPTTPTATASARKPDMPGKANRPDKLDNRAIAGQEKRRLTRNKIIEAALPVFAAHGPDAPVIDDFIKAAGVSRGTFYNYFPTTQALLAATVEMLSDDVVSAILPVVAEIRNPVLRFSVASRIYYRRACNDPVLCEFVNAVVSTHRASLTEESVLRDLRQCIKEGLVTVRNVDVAYAVVVGTMNVALHRVSEKGARALPGKQVVRAMLQGVGVAPALIEEAVNLPLPALTNGLGPPP